MEAEAPGFEATSSSSSREQSPSAPVQQRVEGPKHENKTATPAGDESPTTADSVKEEGLRAFRAGDWRGATDAWSRGLRTLEYILAKEDEFDEDKKQEFVAVSSSFHRHSNKDNAWELSLVTFVYCGACRQYIYVYICTCHIGCNAGPSTFAWSFLPADAAVLLAELVSVYP